MQCLFLIFVNAVHCCYKPLAPTQTQVHSNTSHLVSPPLRTLPRHASHRIFELGRTLALVPGVKRRRWVPHVICHWTSCPSNLCVIIHMYIHTHTYTQTHTNTSLCAGVCVCVSTHHSRRHYRMCSLTIKCVLLLKLCRLTIECVLSLWTSCPALHVHAPHQM